jgi:hypothetical protein
MPREIAIGFLTASIENRNYSYLFAICATAKNLSTIGKIPPIVQYILPKRLQPFAEDREKAKAM